MAAAAADTAAVVVVVPLCDLCGDEVDACLEPCVRITCSFCEKRADIAASASSYHSRCIGAHIRTSPLSRFSQKSGFPCPRGCGKGTAYDDRCPGQVLKTHSMVGRNDKKRQDRITSASRTTTTPKPKLKPKPMTMPRKQHGDGGQPKTAAAAAVSAK